jgi:hypothetical protein
MPNYRNVYKSNHLGVVDLEELIELNKSLIFTIKEVKQEINTTVAGKNGNFNIAYFVENIKPLVLNSGNASIVRRLSGGSVLTENWKNILVEMYIDHDVKFAKQVVGGIKIKPNSPKTSKPIATEQTMKSAKEKGATMQQIEDLYQVSDELKKYYATL